MALLSHDGHNGVGEPQNSEHIRLIHLLDRLERLVNQRPCKQTESQAQSAHAWNAIIAVLSYLGS